MRRIAVSQVAVSSLLLASVAGGQDKLPDAASGTPGVELGKRFAGAYDVSFCPFVDAKAVDKISPGEIARFTREDKQWLLTCDRAELPDAMPLRDFKNAAGQSQAGYLSQTINKLRAADPKVDVLRQDPIDLGDLQIGIVALVTQEKRSAARPGGGPVLVQQALIQVTPKLYYGLVMTCPVATADAAKDPAGREAAETFKAVVDSIERVDLRELRRDQEDRILRGRGLFAAWSRSKLLSVLVPERYLRVRQKGRDVGYVYVVEQAGDALPRTGEAVTVQPPSPNATGVLVGVRSRFVGPDGKTTDNETFSFVTFDRRHEVFSSKTVVTDPSAKRERDKVSWATELGSSDHADERVFDQKLKHDDYKDLDEQNKKDPTALPYHLVDRYTLKVTSETATGVARPMEKELPPFYLPGALLLLLPRIVPLDQPAGYLFYVYNSGSRQVLSEYVDVGSEADCPFGPPGTRAVPVILRQKHDGSPTTYYLTRRGELLGSVNEDLKVTATPTDRATLEGIWKDALGKAAPTTPNDPPK